MLVFPQPPIPEVSLDPATTAWINAVIAAGGAVSATQQSRVNALIVSLKAHSLFSANSRLWLFLGESDARQANIDIMNLSTHTIHGTETLSAGGYTGGGTTADYIDLGALPSNFTQNSGSLLVYDMTSRASGTGASIGSENTAGTAYSYIQQYESGSAFTDLNGFSFPSVASSNAQGLWLVNRNASATTIRLLKNSSLLGSLTSASIANIDQSVYVSAYHALGAAAAPSSDKHGIAGIFGALTPTNETNLFADVNAYATAWGQNTY